MLNKTITTLAIIFAMLSPKQSLTAESTPLEAKPQGAFTDFYIGCGLVGTNFMEDSPSWILIQPIDNTKEARNGGSFDGVETGIHFSLITNLDTDHNWLLPLTFEYNWLKAGEDVPLEKNVRLSISHRISTQKIGTGIQWQFYTFPFKDVRAYIGAEAKAVFVNNQLMKMEDKVIGDNGVTQPGLTSYKYKPDAVRFGSEIKLGFRGELINDFFINTSLGMEVVNLLGRDDKRGELFTAFDLETKEQLVPQWHFVLMLEYKI